MDTFEAIQRRRSVRRLTGANIPKDHIEKIVDAGRLAATGNNRQPWDFIVVTNRQIIKQLSVPKHSKLNSNPIYWIVEAIDSSGSRRDLAGGFPTKEDAERWKTDEKEKREESSRDQILEVKPLYPYEAVHSWIEESSAIVAVVMDPSSKWWMEDGSAAVENILIASTALGYGSCWLGGYTESREEEFKDLLMVPKDRRIFSLVSIGVPTIWPKLKKKSLDQVIHWEKW